MKRFAQYPFEKLLTIYTLALLIVILIEVAYHFLFFGAVSESPLTLPHLLIAFVAMAGLAAIVIRLTVDEQVDVQIGNLKIPVPSVMKEHVWFFVGFAIFLFAFPADQILHFIFGVEVSFDAALSPTHIFFAVGIFMVFMSNFVHGLNVGPSSSMGYRDMFPVFLSAGTALGFLMIYTNLVNPLIHIADFSQGFVDIYEVDAPVFLYIGGAILQTLFVFAFMALADYRWQWGFPALGWTTILFIAGGMMMATFSHWQVWVLMTVTGLEMDVFASYISNRDQRLMAHAVAFPLFLWTFYLAIYATDAGWTPYTLGAFVAFPVLFGGIAPSLFLFYMKKLIASNPQ